MMKTKTFDCVEMKRQGAKLLRARLAGLTLEQEIQYWQRRSKEFSKAQRRRAAPPPTDTTTVQHEGHRGVRRRLRRER